MLVRFTWMEKLESRRFVLLGILLLLPLLQRGLALQELIGRNGVAKRQRLFAQKDVHLVYDRGALNAAREYLRGDEDIAIA